MYITQGSWSLCKGLPLERAVKVWGLKPIKKEVMKEYLFKYNDCYTLVKLSKEDAESKPEQYIEVPDGAIALTQNEYRKMHFWKDGDFAFCIGRDSEFYKSACTIGDVIHNEGWSILWQRHKEEAVDLMQTNGISVSDGVGRVDTTLAERESQYGSFSDVAELTCDLMGDLIRAEMSFVQREALHMICSKLARIRCGDINKIDSWHDIAGYATLVVQDLEKKSIDSANINKTDNRDWVEEIEKNT